MKQDRIAESIFFYFCAINILIMVILLLLSKGEFVSALTYDESNFADFWSHIGRLLFSENIYDTDADAIFPPLAYLFLKLFAYPLIYKAEAGNEIEQIARSGYGILMVLMYLLLFYYLFMIAVNIFYETESRFKKTVLLGIFIFSYSVWGFAVERGNLILYTMLFLMLGLALRNSPNKALREIALVFTAVSAGFKLYPAIFGFVWIAEKKYKEAVRLVIYGLTAFFVPFLFVDSFRNYINTFKLYLDKRMYSHASIWGSVINTFGDNKYTQLLCRGLVASIIIWALALLFIHGVNWKTITLLTATQTILIPEQYVYTYVLIIIPLIFFLNAGDKRKIDYVYAALFAALFTMPPIIGGRGRIMYFIWMLILIMVSVDEFTFLIKFLKKDAKKRFLKT